MEMSAAAVKAGTPKWVLFTGFVLLAAAAVLLFVGYSAAAVTVGFPLDDAWIHQTYARNLAQNGEWAFLPGVPSTGSTSPLWTVLLAAGHLEWVSPYTWTFLLGLLALAGLAYVGELLYRRSGGRAVRALPLAGIFLAVEWHLVWAAASGMETIAYALWIMLVFYLLAQEAPKWGWIGLLVGASAWVRPDGITLMGPALFMLVLFQQPRQQRAAGALWMLLGFGAGFIPYLLFNRLISGSWFPNTFYAKQAEYAIYQQIPLVERFVSLAVLPLIGAGVLLLPGAVYAVWGAARRKERLVVAMFLWWAGYTLLYAVRLPVTYQHGRYLMPAMPVYFMLGLIGTAHLFGRISWRGRLQYVGTRGLLAATAAVLLSFFALGAAQYRTDVGIIETEMVRTARWAAAETEPDALIAAHDIGAFGYFGQRQLLDLAGLISPEVIPFIRDEDRLAAYLDESGVNYLVSFPDWYPVLVQRGEAIYQTGGTFAPGAGGENMVVYRWQSEGR
jgi:hypothetical protein